MNALSERIGAILDLDPSAPALEFEGRWYSWGDLARTADDVDAALAATRVGEGANVGVLLRNRPVPVGLMLGCLRAGACLVTINPTLGAQRVHADLMTLDVAVLAGERADVEAHVDDELAPRAVVLALDDLGAAAPTVPPTRDAPAPSLGVAVRMLTSGTTGPPRPIDLTYETLWRVMQGAKHYEANAKEQLRLRAGTVVVNSPMVPLGGLFRIIQAVTDGRSFALLERFAVAPWIDA